MPLSEYEQRVLEQMERDLDADPSLKKSLSAGRRSSSRVVLAVAGVLGGLVILVVSSILQQPVVGIVGFALMLGVVVWALFSPQKNSQKKTSRADASSVPSGKAPGKGFFESLEERFQRRRDNGDI